MPVSRTFTRAHAKISPGPALTPTFEQVLQEAMRRQMPTLGKARWPADIAELADKIQRGDAGSLFPGTAPVTNADRNRLLAALPRGIAVEKNDPTLYR